ncbi:MAG: hypothetical protein AAF368_04250 [Planctomycetota bacterium]
MMTPTLDEIRARSQAPVAKYNDVAGRLVGDRLSIHFTRLFLQRGWSPTCATLGMLFFGLVGSAFLPFGGVSSVVGFALVFLYYVCDCIDGEVARFRKIEDLSWGFHDFLFHLYVKSAFFLALGVWAARSTGEGWMFVVGVVALLGALFTKFLEATAILVTARQVLLKPEEQSEGMLSRLGAWQPAAEPEGPGSRETGLGLLRAVLTNFDLSILLFLTVAVIDLFAAPTWVGGLALDGKTLLLCFYAVLLPLDYLDRKWTLLRSDGFRDRSRRLLAGAERFRAEQRNGVPPSSPEESAGTQETADVRDASRIANTPAQR